MLRFEDWDGFDKDLFELRDMVQGEINDRRTDLGTYTHPRQTKAEAEVAIIVDGIRNQRLNPPKIVANDAFFLSNSTVVDRLPNLTRRICLLPEGLGQWLWSSQTTSRRHAELVFEQLLWELVQGGIEFVDKATLLRKFSGVVEASNAELNATIKDRRDYLVEKFGPDPSRAFEDADPLDIPRFNTEVEQEVLEQMERLVAIARKREKEARRAAKISDEDREELTRHRERQRQKQRKAKKSLRAAQSRTGKKRGRGRKRK